MNKLKEKILLERERIEKNLNGRILCRCNRERHIATKAFREVGFPTSKTEDWIYTNLKFIAENDFNIVSKKVKFDNIDSEMLHKINEYTSKYYTIVLINGFYYEELSNIDINKETIRISSVKNLLANEPHTLEKFSFYDLDYKRYIFKAINSSIYHDGCFVQVKCNKIEDAPIYILNISYAEKDEKLFVNPHNIIGIGKNSIGNIVNVDLSFGEGLVFNNTLTDCFIDDYGVLDYYSIQTNRNSNYHIDNISVNVSQNAAYNKTTITTDGKFVRNTDYVRVNGKDASVTMNGLFYIIDENFTDNHTNIEHTATGGRTRENYKGIIDDKGKGVFNGMILVQPNAQQTNAIQSNKNILLSNDAKIRTKPELEIYADDVICNHGATSGGLNKEDLFYLKARGISEEKANSLLLYGFAMDIIDSIKLKEVRKMIKDDILDKLKIDI